MRLGYDCKASTSEIQDDSVILTRESVEKYLKETVEAYTEMSPPSEKNTYLNINVEKHSPFFTNSVTILCTEDAEVCLFERAPCVKRKEEVMQPTRIEILEKQLTGIRKFERADVKVFLDRKSERNVQEIVLQKTEVTSRPKVYALLIPETVYLLKRFT